MKTIETIGVVGAGQQGRGIAQLAASNGIHVMLVDVDRATAEASRERMAQEVTRRAVRRRISGADADRIVALVRAEAELSALADCDFVVEAVTEDVALKQRIFRDLDATLRPETIIASNTSSISLTKLAAATRRPPRVIGLHFMHPVPAMKLVEIVRALQTSDAMPASACTRPTMRSASDPLMRRRTARLATSCATRSRPICARVRSTSTSFTWMPFVAAS